MRKINPSSKRRRLSGGALISALFITAIAAIISVALAMQQRLLIHEGELVLNADQSYLNLQGMQLTAEDNVQEYVMQWMNPKQMPPQFTPLKNVLPEVKINDSILNGVIDDEQGKFNLNDLVYTANQSNFVALLQAVVQGISPQESDNIAKAITAFISNNSQDPYYLSLNPAYRSPQNEMVNISELRLVNGVTPLIFSALAPYITALPIKKPSQHTAIPAANAPATTPTTPTTPTQPDETATQININSASAPVLLAADPTMTLAQAERLVQCRKRSGEFTNVAAFIKSCAQPAGITALNNIGTTSQYFLVRSQDIFNHHAVMLNSLLVTRVTKDNKLKIIVVWQSFE
jgi:general secretion pathway protein K